MFSTYSSMVDKARVKAGTVQAYRNRGFSIQDHESSLLHDPELYVTPCQVEKNIYHVNFDCEGKALTLRVKLHQDKTQPPSIKLAGGVIKAKHLWLDPRTLKVNGYMPITCVSKWMDSGLKLNQAVHKIIQEFQQNPPEIISVDEKEMINVSSSHLLAKNDPPVPIAPPIMVQEENVVDQIVKLADLFHQGILTEDEFKEAKSKLILKM